MMLKVINYKEAEKVMLDAEILERVSIDTNSADDLPKDALYIGGYLKDKLFAVAMYLITQGHMTCHVHVLKKYRGQYGYMFGKKALNFSPTDYLLTSVPTIYDNVMRYVELLGFKLINTIPDAIKKNGKKVDVSVYERYL